MVFLQSLLPWFLQDQHPISLFYFFFPLIIILIYFFYKNQSADLNNTINNLPPSPPKLPIIGNLHQLGTLPHRSLRALSERYGPLMLLHIGHTPTIVISSAEVAKEIMKTHDSVFSNRPIITSSKAFVFGSLGIAFAPYGEYWRQLRKISVVDLLHARRVQSYKYVREEEIASVVKKLREVCVKEEPVNLGKILLTFTNNLISRIAFGRKLNGEDGVKSELAMVITESMELFGSFSVEDMFPSLGWIDVVTGLDRKMKRTSKALHDFLDEVIDEHMILKGDDVDDDRKDFVDILLHCQKDLSLGIPITRNDIKSVVMDMFIAGTDTTYTTLEWAMAELMRHPKVMKRVQEEVRLVTEKKYMVDENDISQMHYLNCVIKETLRLHPPLVFSLPRVSTAPTVVGSYYIPAKTRAMINVWAIARDPKIWSNPDEFIPDRFIDNPIDFKGLHFEYIPFGAGRRGCPGMSFGLTSVESILANLLHWFDWKLPCDDNKVDLETEVFGLSVRLKYPLNLVPIFRSA